MLVDDEEEIRLGIIKKIKWEDYGFEIIADAENGRDALEKAEKLKPDIIITDIKMPRSGSPSGVTVSTSLFGFEASKQKGTLH